MIVCRWMAEVTRVRRPKPQNDPGAYTLASWSQCGYQDNCANIMSATCRCGMSFVLHFALWTWASETSMDGEGRRQCWFCPGGGRNASGRYSIVRVAKLVTGLSPCWSKPGLSCLVRIFIGDCFQPLELADQCSNLELSQQLSRA